MSYRFFINKISENRAEITGGDFNHIVNVLRLKKDDEIFVFNYEYGEYAAKIKEINNKEKKVIVSLEELIRKREKNNIKLCAIVSLIKKEKWEFVLEKLTEIGIDIIIPYLAKRSVVKIEKVNEKKERWQKIIYSAVKQCGRLSEPEIKDIIFNIDELKLENNSKKFFIWEKEEKNLFIDEVVKSERNISNVYFIIGPEGGFEDEEAEKLLKSGFIPVSIGDTVLRAETAIIAVASILSQVFRRSKWKN